MTDTTTQAPCIWIQETFRNDTKGYILGEGPPFESFTSDLGKLYRSLQHAYGRCQSKVYVDKPDGSVKAIGWVFVSRQRYEEARADHTTRKGKRVYSDDDYYLRAVWVTLMDKPPTVTTEYHYHELAS